jgi:hypothetical protein
MATQNAFGNLALDASVVRLGKNEDVAAATGDTGIAMLGVRSDTPLAATTDANGDYTQATLDSAGQQWVKPGRPLPTDPALVPFRATAVAGTAQVVKTSAGRIRRVRIYNPNTSVAFLQVINLASGATLGNAALVEEFVVPAGTVFAENIDVPTAMSAGISIAASTTAGGTTAVTTGLHVQIWYV